MSDWYNDKSSSESSDDYHILPQQKVKKLPNHNSREDFPDLQKKSFEPEFHKVLKKQPQQKIYVFMVSYDKQKGSQEKSMINLLANSLKDYVHFSFAEIKNMADTNKLTMKNSTETTNYIQWEFVWTIKDEFFKELMGLKEIIMRTAAIYFKEEPYLDPKLLKQPSGMSPIKPENKILYANSSLNLSNQKNNNNKNSSSNGSSKINKDKKKKQVRVFSSPEEEQRYNLKKKYKLLMQENKNLRYQIEQVQQAIQIQQQDPLKKMTQFKGFIDILQVMLDSDF